MASLRTLAVLLGTALPLFAQAPAGPTVRGELGKQLHDWLTRAKAFGMHGAVLIAQDGEILLHHGYGLANRATREPITWQTRFHIGSLGKQFTAAAVAGEVERGALTWETTLAEALEDVQRGVSLVGV